jgi:hypothetical protein
LPCSGDFAASAPGAAKAPELPGKTPSDPAVSGTPFFLVMLFQQRIEKRFRSSKTRTPKLSDRLCEANQAAFRREIEDAERAGYAKSFPASRHHALAVIHKQHIGAHRCGQRDGSFLSFVEPSSEP